MFCLLELLCLKGLPEISKSSLNNRMVLAWSPGHIHYVIHLKHRKHYKLYVCLQRDIECSPQPAAEVARSSTHLPHHHAWWHCDRSHRHADPSSQVYRGKTSQSSSSFFPPHYKHKWTKPSLTPQVWCGPHSQPGAPSGPWEMYCWWAWSCPSH